MTNAAGQWCIEVHILLTSGPEGYAQAKGGGTLYLPFSTKEDCRFALEPYRLIIVPNGPRKDELDARRRVTDAEIQASMAASGWPESAVFGVCASPVWREEPQPVDDRSE